jgi:hypothetical protein
MRADTGALRAAQLAGKSTLSNALQAYFGAVPPSTKLDDLYRLRDAIAVCVRSIRVGDNNGITTRNNTKRGVRVRPIALYVMRC